MLCSPRYSPLKGEKGQRLATSRSCSVGSWSTIVSSSITEGLTTVVDAAAVAPSLWLTRGSPCTWMHKLIRSRDDENGIILVSISTSGPSAVCNRHVTKMGCNSLKLDALMKRFCKLARSLYWRKSMKGWPDKALVLRVSTSCGLAAVMAPVERPWTVKKIPPRRVFGHNS